LVCFGSVIGALPALGNSESPVPGGKVQLPGTEVIDSSSTSAEEKGQSILPTHGGVTGNLPISQTGTKSENQPIGTGKYQTTRSRPHV